MSSGVTKRTLNPNPITLQYCNQLFYSAAHLSSHIHIILIQIALVLLFSQVILILTQYIVLILKSSFRNFQDLSFTSFMFEVTFIFLEAREKRKREKDHSALSSVHNLPCLARG